MKYNIKKGSDNRAADSLSRMEHSKEEPHSHAISTQVPLWVQEIQNSYEGNTLFLTIIQAKTIDTTAFPDYNYEKGILRKKGRICVGSHGDIRKKIIKTLHDSALGGLPPSEGKDSVLVIVDRLTKYSHFIPLKHPYTATAIAKIFFDNIYELHGLPVSIVTDRDRVFTSRFWRELFTLAGVSLDITEREFEVGDEVFLKLQPYKQTSVALRRNIKLSVKYFGPFKILGKIGKVAYRLELLPSSRVHPVFHVSLLKKKIRSKYIPSLNPEIEDEVFKVYPATILVRRLVPRNNVGVPQVLIQWSHSSPDQATWEDYKDMAAKFPRFDPWGQGLKKGGRDVTFQSQNATLSGHCPIARADKDRQIEGGIQIGGELRNSEGSSVVLEKAERGRALSNKNTTSDSNRKIKSLLRNRSIEGVGELGIHLAELKGSDDVSKKLGLSSFEAEMDDGDVGVPTATN
ncbi:UNVERIFIED_CONTAM: hypothetical protein Sradi_5761300 [Sesamum radiatum]|uniref:Tf2-1-like SH3-like domain-containing protein n=1 Tax=Sesamum radiatum TaxID=300843 RepID=A0AAW2L2U4_SESRA